MSHRERDKTELSYWFPKLEVAGIAVPKTRLVTMPRPAQECVWASFDGKDGTSDQTSSYDNFVCDIRIAAEAFGFPCFLRTDHTSAKHSWDNTCFVKAPDDIKRHVFSIVEFSECCGFIGLPYSVWAVREFLPTIPHGTCPNYSNMPVCREFRFFVDDGVMRCAHPYWPLQALNDGGWSGSDIDFEKMCRWPHELKDLAEAAGRAVGGSWSIDILETRRGWYVTDMAEAEKSFHWGGCQTTEAPAGYNVPA